MRRFHHHAARGAGLVLHRLATFAIGTAVIVSILLAAAAWRLSRGPVDLAWLSHRLEAAVNAAGSPVRLSIGTTALAWEGFRLGVDRPLDLRLTDVRLTGADGSRQVDIPRAEVSLSLSALLLGRVQLRAIELDAPRLTLLRAADGTLSIDLGDSPPAPGRGAAAAAAPGSIGDSLPALLALLARPPHSDTTPGPGWSRQLRRVRIDDAVVTVVDRPLGTTWQVPRADVTLNRRPQGGITGVVAMMLVFGDQRARLTGTATLSPDAASTELIARMTPVAPAALARASPRLGFLAAVDAPVAAQAAVLLGPTLQLEHARVTLSAGAGTLHIGSGTLPVVDASLTAVGTPDSIRLDGAQLQLRAQPEARLSTLTATGTIQRDPGRIAADLVVDLDQVAFADLPKLWPAGVGGGAQPWITENITAGIAQDGQLSLGLEAKPDLSDLTVTRASGMLQGNDMTIAWLRPVPPVVQANAELQIVDPDTLLITVAGGRQYEGNGYLSVTGGTMRISGLMQRDQVADLRLGVAGSLPDVIALLREKRLHLLADHPTNLNAPAGDVTATVAATVPLDADVHVDDIALGVTAHIEQAALAGLVVGRNLSDGTLDVTASNDGLTVKGQAQLAGIPANLDVAMDFRAGPPDQVLQRATISGRPDAKQLAAAGLDASGLLAGPIGLQAVLTEQRDGDGRVTLAANLSDATLTVAPLAWHRPLGREAQATAQVRLRHDQLAGIDGITATGDGVTLRGDAQCQDGRITAVRLDRVVLGHTEAQGSVTLPESPKAGPIAVRLTGPELDLSARLTQPTTGRHPHKPEPPPGPPWTLDARFDRVVMAHGTMVAPLRVDAENDGRVFRRLNVDGRTRDKGVFTVQITPDGNARRLTATAAEAGDLLRALDVTNTMEGGSLTVTGTYDDAAPFHPLRGTADLSDFRVAHAVALGKLLQAMTLYGLVDALSGPGLSFQRLTAPFSYADGVLTLTDARAFSASLGLTAKGWLDLDANTVDTQGTIVPAYFFNSLLGNVPLVGRLFSPERGGGVFAASYTLKGNLNDPSVGVNPLTALTPGFLRGLFRLF